MVAIIIVTKTPILAHSAGCTECQCRSTNPHATHRSAHSPSLRSDDLVHPTLQFLTQQCWIQLSVLSFSLFLECRFLNTDKSPGNLKKKLCTSNTFPGDVGNSGPWATLQARLMQTLGSSRATHGAGCPQCLSPSAQSLAYSGC